MSEPRKKKSGRRVIVLGDVMLDRTTHGWIRGPSPENQLASVFVKEGIDETGPGGAANVACGVVELGMPATLFAAVGNDVEGQALLTWLGSHYGVDHVQVPAAISATIVKHRFATADGLAFRVDREFEPASLKPYFPGAPAARLDELLESDYPPVVVFVDYDKGFFQAAETIALCSYVCSSARLVLVDPGRRGDWARFVGGDNVIFKANISQAVSFFNQHTSARFAATPVSARQKHSRDWYLRLALLTRETAQMKRVGLLFKALWLTLGEAGSVVVFPDGDPCFIEPYQSREVADVCGAGDTALAAMAVAYGNEVAGYVGESTERQVVCHCVRLANIAAALAVSRRGVQRPTQREWLAAREEEDEKSESAAFAKNDSGES